MGGGGFGRAYASGSNTKINQAALLKAAARAPKPVSSVLVEQQKKIAEETPYKVPLGSISTEGKKVGDRDYIYDDAGNKVGFTLFKEQKRYDGYGNVIDSKVVPRTTYYSPTTVQDTRQRKESYGTTNIAEIAAQLKAEAPAKVRTGRDLYNEFDPNRGAMLGHSVDSYNQAVNYDRPLLQAFKDLEIPAYKEFGVPELDTGGLDYDKTKLYTNYGKRGQLEFPNEAARQEYYEKERTGTFHDVSGLLGIDSELGNQTMVWVKNPPEPSKWEKFLGNPVLQVIGLLNPTIALATTGAKLASGVDVSPVEIASGLMTGLNTAGVVKPPVPNVAGDKGTGLFGSTYGQTQTALNVAAAGDAKGAAFALVGDDLIKGGLDNVGLDRATIERAGIQYDDFQAGIGKVVSAVAGGAELDNALASGLGTYIREGGTLGSIDLPETNIDLGVIEDVVRDVVRPLGKVGTEIAKFVEEAVPEDVDKIEDAIRQAGRTTEDVVRAGGRAVDQAVIQPTREVAKAFDDAVIQPVGDAFSALDTAVRQALPSTRLNVPNFNPNLGQSGLQFTRVSDTGEPATQPSSTRTTDALFGDELFKFKTPIEDTQERLDYIDLNSPFDQSQELELELTYPDSTEESDGFFEGTIYEQQPRSYNF